MRTRAEMMHLIDTLLDSGTVEITVYRDRGVGVTRDSGITVELDEGEHLSFALLLLARVAQHVDQGS